MGKDALNVHVFQNRNWCSPKSDWQFFFKLWLSEDLSTGKTLSEKKICGFFSEKTEALYAELHKTVETASSSYSATGNILQYIYSVLTTKNHQKIWSRCLVNKFSFPDIF